MTAPLHTQLSFALFYLPFRMNLVSFQQTKEKYPSGKKKYRRNYLSQYQEGVKDKEPASILFAYLLPYSLHQRSYDISLLEKHIFHKNYLESCHSLNKDWIWIGGSASLPEDFCKLLYLPKVQCPCVYNERIWI